MKGTYIAIFCTLALAAGARAAARVNADPSQAAAICAAEGSDSILVAHQDCDKFFKCFQGHPVAISCPVGLLYNAQKEYCDWPQNVNCQKMAESTVDSEASRGNSDPSKAPAICAAEGSDGTLVAHDDCSKFFKCFGGEPVAINCPLNLLYNPAVEYCDWPENVECGSVHDTAPVEESKEEEEKEVEKEELKEEPKDEAEAAEICAAEDSDGKLVAHGDCNKFYKCSEGAAVVLDCPLNLLYNPATEYCDWPENVQCGAVEEPKEEEKEEQKEEDIEAPKEEAEAEEHGEAAAICKAEESSGVLLAHEDCSKFFVCSEGKPVIMNCPLNLLYNPETQYCDWPENVNACK